MGCLSARPPDFTRRTRARRHPTETSSDRAGSVSPFAGFGDYTAPCRKSRGVAICIPGNVRRADLRHTPPADPELARPILNGPSGLWPPPPLSLSWEYKTIGLRIATHSLFVGRGPPSPWFERRCDAAPFPETDSCHPMCDSPLWGGRGLIRSIPDGRRGSVLLNGLFGCP